MWIALVRVEHFRQRRTLSAMTQRKMAMTHFTVGDQVVIRYGKHQGEKAKIMKSIRADDYKIKTEEGFVLFYSGKGLAKA
jgi:hypothetical protein